MLKPVSSDTIMHKTATIENVEIYQSCSNCGAELVNINGGNIDHKGAVNIYKI
jgi:hypothetical protein